jgi:holliday junction DNA helicase RuvA
MIGKLKGTIDRLTEDQIIIDVNGVGYIVYCSTNTLSKIGGVGNNVSLLIETIVREDAFNLYGFATEEEKHWFHLLTQKVNGVGAKMAISILSSLTPKDLAVAIASKDKAVLRKASGVGPKLAERIVLELQDAASKSGFDNVVSFKSSEGSVGMGENNHISDAAQALEKLGFGRSEAFTTISQIISEKGELQRLGDILCHPERSEGSHLNKNEILRYTQNDKKGKNDRK